MEMETATHQAAALRTKAGGVSTSPAEARFDPITGEWTIFAPHRENRPQDFQTAKVTVARRHDCPFCHGNESATPPTLWMRRTPDSDPALPFAEHLQPATEREWSVRVVDNKYPAVSLDGDSRHDGDGRHRSGEWSRRPSTSPLFRATQVAGGHEVIIESPEHVESLSQLDVQEIALVFAAYRSRLRHWRSVPGIRYISVFKNVGSDAGASLQHSHSQLIASNIMPSAVRSVVERMQQHHASTGCCLQCDLIRGELKAKQRVVAQTDSLIAYCPHASRMPMLVRITTKSHAGRFEDLSLESSNEAARLTRRVIRWLEKLRPGTAYNFLLHTRPPGAAGDEDGFHWSIEIFPRMTKLAGFELSSQCMINPVLPEQSAAQFRQVAAAEDPRRTP